MAGHPIVLTFGDDNITGRRAAGTALPDHPDVVRARFPHLLSGDRTMAFPMPFFYDPFFFFPGFI